MIGAGHKDVGEEAQAYIALPFGEGRSEGVAVEGSGKAVATTEDVPNPLTAEGRGHDLGDDLAAIGVGELRLFLEAPNGFAIGRVWGHWGPQWTV